MFFIFYTISIVESAGIWKKAKREYCCYAEYQIQLALKQVLVLKSDEKFITDPGKKRAHFFIFPTAFSHHAPNPRPWPRVSSFPSLIAEYSGGARVV